MKKLLFILLLVSSSSLTFSESTERMVRVYGDYPIEKLDFFQSISRDTLIFDHVDTIYNTGWEWGWFIPESNNLCIQNSYYKVNVTPNTISGGDFIFVSKCHQGKKQVIASYFSNSRWIYWIAFFLVVYIHYLVYDRLKRFLFKLNRRGRHVPVQRKMNETAAAVIIVVLCTGMFGWYIHSYFFLFCPIIYLLFMLMPSGRWHHYFTKRSERAIGI
ncbi:MAG: hypothetical protein ACD_80C00013G0007 [uncultured bacterium (gcode 4)]|uniref:Integron gene cassette protein n=1 Tax=uncultured bacterium (gcode 4) TaxID=1234023 RepID=K1XKA1_9BACT|nr:MAG: hypothetical protein ACD_80C00013G0007 [uncultured bacterium (gcode 4)]HBB04864.1 hypothetical protein [Candidatus Gracilibacteria bacterium]